MNASQAIDSLLQHYGYAAVFALPMLESTGFPVPGETMLLAAAVYAATTGRLNIAAVIACAAMGAILGDNFGYALGRKGGRALVLRYGRYIRIGEKQLRTGERFFARHGDQTVFFARFIAVLRTIGAFLAGASEMRYRNFLIYNAIGGVAWATLFGTLAYLLGKQFDRYQSLIARFGVGLAVVVVLAVVLLYVFGKERLERWALGDDPD
jgi:membrane protein DedA with SNARE-associated domain